ncbi:putative protein phosphatase 2C 24 [Solanum tuberosum]|uniref:putative protein phosphatase 2C 24 n=1 Tax=Solanum tuberosum TaxID=4113 RepID=UPI00073A046C|nr:PREDICTED: putative protein phosphatase 2C 24 [Solanum tuberosum]
MVAGSFYIPKSNKAPLWEDAHFICIEEETIGVADGIGGWAKRVSILENIQDNCYSKNRGCASDGTDGLFDNAHDTELEKLVCDGLVDLRELGTFSKMLARKIAEYALQKSENKSIYTPFAIDCLKVGKYRVGSKRDDIIVIVAHILPR